ncbi:RagB/SusD family nutrient uptake outer membrane protein [Flavobacteriaceae bacterium F08102]|nr:RagB/SusD family nutrient uptake outer membrane protein [Flavobacteriaceae bacterium F08102]
MKKLIYISLIILIIGASSCEDHLDLTPSYSLNEKNAITNSIKARAAVNGIYETIVNEDHYSGKLYVSLASKSGFVKWSSADYKMEYSQSNQTTSNIESRWKAYYKTLNTANFTINGISKLSDVQIKPEERNALVAEARFLRAFANTYLFWNYGHWWSSDDSNPNGILYRDKAITIGTIEGARLTVGESYEKIYEDLDFAIEHLNSFSSNRYVSKEFAKVFKAKVMLYRNAFNDGTTGLDEALTLVNEVLDANIAGFAMQEDLAQVYQDSWDSEENLFSGYVSDDADRTYNTSYTYSFTMIMSYGNRLPLPWYQELNAGLNQGADWFLADPRWDVVTGEARAPINWDTTPRYTWTKVARLGQYAGQRANPPDEKYNTYFFRYPELYIMKAELLARTGASIEDAIAPINTMRSIRTNPALPSLNPTTQQELMDAIFKEYFLETFIENGSEYFASLRFKDSSGQLWIEVLRNAPLDVNRLCYPIPNTEMDLNPLIEQNTDLQ